MLTAIVVSVRPRQWVKNLFVFAAVIFSRQLFTPLVWHAAAAFLIFCALSGAMYLFNDVVDRGKDRVHPRKRERPVAAGRLSPRAAVAAGVLLLAAALAAAAVLSRDLVLVAVGYITLLTAYSLGLKHVVIVDVIVVACGFVLRAVAGAV